MEPEREGGRMLARKRGKTAQEGERGPGRGVMEEGREGWKE